MADSDTFDVIVTGFSPGDETPALRLHRVFGLQEAAAEKLLARLPAPVQRRVPRVRAEYFRRALVKIGAQVEVRDGEGALYEALAPDSVPPPRPSVEHQSLRRDTPAEGTPAIVLTDAAWSDSSSWLPPVSPASAATIADADLAAMERARASTAQLDAVHSGGTADTLVDQNRGARLKAAREAQEAQEAQAAASAQPAPDAGAPWPILSRSADPTAVDPVPPKHELGPEALRAPATVTLLEGKPVAPPGAPPAMPPGMVVRDAAESLTPARMAQPTAIHAPAVAVPDPVPAVSIAADPTVVAGWRAPSPQLDAPRPAPAASAPQPSAPGYSLGDLDLPGGPAAHASAPSFHPPPLELGGPASEEVSVLSRLPSSVWDAPPPPKGAEDDLGLPNPPAGPATALGRHGGRRAPRELSQPSRNDDPLTLDPTSPLGATPAVSKWEADPAMSEPPLPNERRSLRAPRSSSPKGLGLSPPPPAGALSKPPSAAPAPLDLPSASPPARVERARAPAAERPRRPRKSAPRAKAERSAPAAPVDTRSFSEALPDALAVPWSGPGLGWVGLISAWWCVAALLSELMLIVPPLGALFVFFALGSVLAITCDYFRACFWLAPVGATRLDRAPALDATRFLHAYLKSGVHLTLLVLTVGLPLIIWIISALGQGVSPVALMSEAGLWGLALLPGVLWPALVTLTALRDNLRAIWNVPQALAAIRKAPREYALIVAIGAGIFCTGVWLMLGLCDTLGLTGVMLTAGFGLPLAVSHGVMGVLMGHLVRTREGAFG